METLPREVTSVSKYEIEPFKQGRRVGCYLLGKTLGEGSFAKVKEGLHIITGERVAVKIIDKKRAREDRYISKNLRREARIHQLVRHPNIIQLYEVLETDHYYYLIMEYSDGGELLDYICSRKRLDEHVVRRLVSQLVSAVDGMHKSGVVHRDLKIENFLLSHNEDLKIIDFGLSNTLSQDCMQEFERTGVFPQLLNTHCGSPAYAAPELLAQKKYGPQVDIWSIGINMYAMLTGFLPYMMEPFNVMEMYEKMMQRKMTPVPSFLSQACRDLLMRLLEPVAEWRITLKQVMKHKWFTGTEYIPRSIPLGDMMYQKKELCEPVLAYMKMTLRIRTKDTINAVVSNRAVHASAVYHLLVARLDRYLKNKKERSKAKENHFAKLEIIKKSNLSTENVNSQPTSNTRNHHPKRFTFRGKKIDSKTRSHPNLGETENLADDEEDNVVTLIDQTQNTDTSRRKVSIDNTTNEKHQQHTKNNSSNHLKVIDPAIRMRGHRRSNSSADVNELRKSQEIVESIRNSLICDSKGDLEKMATNIKKKAETASPSPRELFPKGAKGIVTRKQSFDVSADFLGSPSNGDKTIDVTQFIEQSTVTPPRRNSGEKLNQKHRKMSLDVFDAHEPNVKEQKEPVPGWLITKVVKQPPLKEEHTSIDGKREQNGSPSPRNQRKHKRVIHRPGTPEQQKQNTDQTNNEESEERSSSVSDRIRQFSNRKKNEVSTRVQTPEIEEILRNVRSINKTHLSDDSEETTKDENLPTTPKGTGSKWQPPQFQKTNSYDSKPRAFMDDTDSSISSTPSPPLINNDEFSNDSCDGCDVNNNSGKQNVDKALNADMTNPSTNSNITPIKTIKISKKTLELNVKQFTQYNRDQKNENRSNLTSHHHTSLKPLQLKFNFTVRKKKAYKEKQQTRSLTDITNGVNNKMEARPSEEQMLAPKHRCNESCDIVNGECKEKRDQTIESADSAKMERTNNKKTTVKIISHNSNHGNNKSNRTKVFLTTKKSTSKDHGTENEKQDCRLNSDNCSFDSGYFGTNSSITNTTENKTNSHREENQASKTKQTKTPITPSEIHPVKYRCIPVYQPEYVKTGTVHTKENLEKMEEKNGDSANLHKKWGSQTIEPTQEPFDYLPRSAEFIKNIKEQFRQEREKKIEQLKKDAERKPLVIDYRHARSQSDSNKHVRSQLDSNKHGFHQSEVNNQFSRSQSETQDEERQPGTEFKRSFSLKQYPIERTCVGTPSPKFHRRATYHPTNRTKTQPRTPNGYDSRMEQGKVAAFANALGGAAFRKKPVLASNW